MIIETEVSKESSLPRIFPTLYNIKDFINRSHPIYHPETTKYDQYWTSEERKCIEGVWGNDSDTDEIKYRYCPGVLYYYTNYCVIEDELESENRSEIVHPLLRDIEWFFFYNWIIARGFSGFDRDPNYTSNKIIKKIEDGVELTAKDKIRLKGFKHIYKEDGSYKKYVDPREYLYARHDNILGIPVYENTAQNLLTLTSRRCGKSFWLMAIISHAFKFHGAAKYDESYFNIKKGPEIVVGSVANKAADMFNKFKFNEEYQKDHFGAWGENEDFSPGFFFTMVSGSLTVSNSKSPYRAEYEYKEGRVTKRGGVGTKILHVTYEDNPEASVGTGPIISIVEEVGLMQNLLQVHASNETTLIRANKFGSALYVGTAGNLEKILPTKTIYEDPESYDMLPFPDLWENRQRPIGMFIPAYYTDNSFRDENGNQDIDAAYEDIMAIRAKKAKAEDNFALAGWVMARPVKPSEMFLSGVSNRFPLAQLQEHFTNIETANVFERFSSKGVLKRIDNNKVVFISDINNTLRPIKDTMMDRIIDKKGSIVFYEHPESNIPTPTTKRSLYKICYDPVNHDIDGTSLASIIVYKAVSENDWANGLKDDIVAEFIGRRNLVDEVHDIAINLAIYYNARVLVETNVPDFIRYCRRENFTHLLQPTPHDTISKVVFNRVKKYDVGVDMSSPALHEHAEQLLNQWLLTPWKKSEEGVELLNLHKIKSPRILLELMQYDPTNRNKSDHVASLKLLMLWLAQDKIDPIKNPIENIKEEVALFINRVANRKHIVNVFHNY